ncbi:MAG: hypothetical protein IKM00_07010, partial [Clostridia bacterium]|nr:hypothetical protein [Clostridia bacterium]
KNVLPPKSRAAAKKQETSEFEKFYEPVHKEFSLADAKRIEDESWQTTKILVEAFESDTPAETENVEIVEDAKNDENQAQITEVSESDSELRSALRELSSYVVALLHDDSKKRAAALTALGRSEAVVIDKINEIAADIIGDIIIDGDEGEYFVIEDYLDTLRCELL